MNNVASSLKLEVVWAEYESALRGFLSSKVSNRDDVDDLLQEILLKTHQNLSSIKDTSSVRSWLFQLANRTIIDFYRKRARIARNEDIDAEDLWFESAESESSVEQEMALCIEPFIRALPEESANLLLAVDIHGESQKNVAEVNNVSYSTLKSRVQKSRQELKSLFNQCCDLTLDKHGSVIDYHPKNDNCRGC